MTTKAASNQSDDHQFSVGAGTTSRKVFIAFRAEHDAATTTLTLSPAEASALFSKLAIALDDLDIPVPTAYHAPVTTETPAPAPPQTRYKVHVMPLTPLELHTVHYCDELFVFNQNQPVGDTGRFTAHDVFKERVLIVNLAAVASIEVIPLTPQTQTTAS